MHGSTETAIGATSASCAPPIIAAMAGMFTDAGVRTLIRSSFTSPTGLT